MAGIIIVFGISILCAAGACAIYEKVEKGVSYIVKKRREKKEREAKRAAAKEYFKDFCEKERDRILIRESTMWIKEIECIFADRDKALKNAERGRYFEKF